MSLHSGTRRALLRTQARGNGLLNALIAYWPGNEANGDLIDAHTNGLDLTDINTVTNAAGLVYATARKYTAANNEYHTRPGDDALLSVGVADFTIATWVYLDSKSSQIAFAAKYGASGTYEYALRYEGYDTDRFRWLVSMNGNSQTNLYADTFGPPSLAVWYLLIASHESGVQISLSVNAGAVDTAAHTTNVFDGAQPFTLGAIYDGKIPHNGRIGPTMFWKSAPGGGGVLTAAQRTALYNGGAGLRYDQFTL